MNEYKNELNLAMIRDMVGEDTLAYKLSKEEHDELEIKLLKRAVEVLKEKNEMLEKERDEALRNEEKLKDEYNEMIDEFNANVEDYNELDDEVEYYKHKSAELEVELFNHKGEIEDLLIKMDMQDEVIDELAEKIEKYEEKSEDFNVKTTILFEVKHDRKQTQIIDDLNLLIEIKDNEIDILEDKLERTNKVLFETDANYHYLKGRLIGMGYTIIR